MTGETNGSLQGRRILVVEDDFIVAETVCEMLEEAGAVVVGPFGWLDEAMAYIKSGVDVFDSALIDLNLHGQKSYPIAAALTARAIGFVFATGYGKAALDEPFHDARRCQKPFNRAALVSALNDLRASGG